MLLTPDADALWVTSWPFAEYVKHRWPGAWINSLFRTEAQARYMTSELIREAVAATRWYWGEPPSLGMVSFIDADEVRHKRDPGRCYKHAGFIDDGLTEGGLIAKRLPPDRMPEPHAPNGAQLALIGDCA